MNKIAEGACRECSGRCCRNEYGYPIAHMAGEHYFHGCDRCVDGRGLEHVRLEALLQADTENTRLRQQVEQLRVQNDKLNGEGARERAAVVAWLRDVADDPETFVEEAGVLLCMSSAIERGEHRLDNS